MARKRRHSRRDVSPQTERDARSVSSSRLSLSEKLVDDYGAIRRRHTGAFDTRSVNDFVNRLNARSVSKLERRREGSQNVGAGRDRRRWHPDKQFVGATVTGREASIFGGDRLQHYDKLSAVVCDQRRERREVLFALGKGGRGHRSRHRWTETSNRSCI